MARMSKIDQRRSFVSGGNGRRGLMAFALLLAASPAFAQSQPPARPSGQTAPVAAKRRSPGRWSVEVHGGGFGELLSTVGKGGAGEPFPTGTPFTTFNGRPSRAVPSWFFGDGAALFNEFQASNGARFTPPLTAITPLDPVLRTAGTTRKPARAIGGRFGGNLTSWFGLELAVDRGTSRTAFSDSVTTGVAATRASYTAAFDAFLDGLNDVRVTTAATLPDASGTQTIVTGSAVLSVVRTSRVGVHAVIGGGFVRNDTSPLEVRLQGGYQANVAPGRPINESETVTIRFSEKPRVPAGVLGLGFTVRVAGNSGLRVDARVLANENTTITSVSSSIDSLVLPVGVGIALADPLTPSLQLSSRADTRPTLSGDPINGLVTHTGGGVELRPHVTVGYFVRF